MTGPPGAQRISPAMSIEYVDTGWGLFPILPASLIDAELRELPTLARVDLRDKLIGPDFGDWAQLWLSEDPEEPNYDVSMWLTRIYDVWVDIRLSLAYALACDRASKSTVPDRSAAFVASLFSKADQERLESADLSVRGCAYYLDSAIHRFYALNEEFLQFCSAYLDLGLTEQDVRGYLVEKKIDEKLQCGDERCAFFAEQVARLCRSPAYGDVAQARKSITHRRHPKLDEVHSEVYGNYVAKYLPKAQQLFSEVTAFLDRLLEHIDLDLGVNS